MFDGLKNSLEENNFCTDTKPKTMSSQDYEQEVKELDSIQPAGAKNYFVPLFPENVYQSFTKILTFAREYVLGGYSTFSIS